MNAVAHIHCPALAHNLSIVRRLAPGARVLAVIKADAYGHGITQMADALYAADGYAVANVEEGLMLRDYGVRKKIVVLQGFSDTAGLQTMSRHRLTPVLHTSEQLAVVEKAHLEQPLVVWIKVDSGMGRLGLSLSSCQKLLTEKRQDITVACLMTHLANADVRDSSVTSAQMRSFATLSWHGGCSSMANSAAILGWADRFPLLATGWIRPGIMLYGVSPFHGETGQEHSLQPAMTLTAPLIAINSRRQGERIGYGEGWLCPQDMPVGIVSIGYGDGYPRHIQAGTQVLLRGKRATIIGRVSMDMLCLDLRDHGQATVGDRVVCWGEGLPIEEIARKANTIPYELLCQLTSRVQRVYQ